MPGAPIEGRQAAVEIGERQRQCDGGEVGRVACIARFEIGAAIADKVCSFDALACKQASAAANST